MKILFAIALSATSILFTACPALNDYDRTITAGADVNTKTGYISYSIKGAPIAGQGRLSGEVRIEGSLADGKQVISVQR